jgi:GNAT superfamily N-acetyltransferase
MVMLHDRDKIEAFLRRDVSLHIYEIGDLDEFFWPHTTWYALRRADSLDAVALLYTRLPLPTLLVLSADIGPVRDLLGAIVHLLPARFYAHLSPGLGDILRPRYDLEPQGLYRKMTLTKPSGIDGIDVAGVVPLSADDTNGALALYAASYPGNWFDRRMLETGQYFGVQGESGLRSVAGVHVYSRRYRVAALGNIATHPDHRRKGLGRATTTRLCRSLLGNQCDVGLNVKADNHSAIALYESLGFEITASYEEFMVVAGSTS